MLNSVGQALSDLGRGFSRHEIWRTMALQKIIFSFRKTWIGPFWMVIETVALIVSVVVLKSMLIRERTEDVTTHLVTGIVLYQIISSYFFGTSSVYLQGKALLHTKGQPTSLPIFIYLARNTISSAYVVFAFLCYIAYIRPDTLPAVTAALLASWLLFIVIGVGSSMVFAPLSARFGDFDAAIGAISRFIFFVTPVFWIPSPTVQEQFWVKYNPLYHLIDFTRDFAMRQPVDLEHVYLAGGFAALILIVGLLVFASYRKTIPLWV